MKHLGKITGLCVIALCLAWGQSAYGFTKGYSGAHSFEFNDIPGFSMDLQNGGKTDIMDVSINGGLKGNLLGCSGVSIKDFFNITFNFNADELIADFTSYLQTTAVKWMLTQMFTSPTLSAIFDGLQALGNARLEMFKQTCSLQEVRSLAREQVREQCIKNAGGDAEAIADCTQVNSASDKNKLQKAAKMFKDFLRSHANVTDNLRLTDFCGGGKRDSLACGLSAFVPQFQLCIDNKCDNKFGRVSQASPPVVPFPSMMAAVKDVFQNGVAKAPENAVDESLQTGLDLSQLVITRRNQTVNFTAPVTPVTSSSLAPISGSSSTTSGGQSQSASIDNGTHVHYFSLNKQPISFAGSAAAASGTTKVKGEFKKYIQCTQTNPYKDLKNFLTQVNKDWGTTLSTNPDDYYDKSALVDLDKFVNLNLAVNDKMYSRLTGQTLPAVADLMETAINCVANHHVHIGVDTVLALSSLSPELREAYYAAAANRAGYLATELMMRFVKHKILTAYMQLSAEGGGSNYYEGGGCEGSPIPVGDVADRTSNGENLTPCGKQDFDFPEGILYAVHSMAEMLENQIQAIHAIKEERDAFAQMSAMIAKKNQEMMSP